MLKNIQVTVDSYCNFVVIVIYCPVLIKAKELCCLSAQFDSYQINKEWH
jgi:hypothetical protein